MNEIIIGICDDEQEYHSIIQQMCDTYFLKNNMQYRYIHFMDGKEVLEYTQICEEQISLLFLDIEMEGIDGLSLKEQLLYSDAVQRIAFVSSHLEVMADAFSQKTIGFVEKPIQEERLHKMLSIVVEENAQNIMLDMFKLKGDSSQVAINKILYLKAERSYTYLYTCDNAIQNMEVISKRLGDLEKILEGTSLIRVHKSYMVNLAYVSKIGKQIEFAEYDIKIPVGRVFSKSVKEQHFAFTRRAMVNRL